MARWLVRVEGDKHDLAELLRCFPDGDVLAVQQADGVYLVGSAFEAFGEAGEVSDRAQEALSEFSSAILLLNAGFRPPALGNVIREDDSGGRKGFVFAAAKVALRSSLQVSGEVIGAEQDEHLPTQAQQLLQGSRADSHLREALSLWADPSKTWPRLYRILEEVEGYLGQPAYEAGLCSSSKHRRFTQTANTAEVAGKDARHALGKFKPPAKPMNLGEATSFIGGILRMVLERAARN